MYQALLTRRYLTSKVMPLLAMAAVMLSVATVLITWSIMGGFLKTPAAVAIKNAQFVVANPWAFR